MIIPIVGTRMVQDRAETIAGVSGDNLTKSVTFIIELKDAAVDLRKYTPLICIEPVEGESYTVLPQMTDDGERVVVDWLLTRFDTRATGRLYVTVKFVKQQADGDVCVWQSSRGSFFIAANVDTQAQGENTEPNVFESVLAKAAEYAQQAREYCDQAEQIKASTEIQFVVEDYRIGLRHAGDEEYVYTADLSGVKDELSEITAEEVEKLF